MGHRAAAISDNPSDVTERRGIDRLHVAETGVHVGRVLQDLADGVERLLDGRVGERDLVSDPLVVGLGAGLAKEEVLHPVGSGPARCRIRAEAGTPRGLAGLRLDGLRQGEELSVGLRNLDAPLLELRRGIPDEALDTRHERRCIERSVGRGIASPVLRPVLLHVGSRRSRLGLDEVARGQIVQEAGLREDRDVRRIAALGPNADLGLELLRALIFDLDFVLLLPVGPRLLEKF